MDSDRPDFKEGVFKQLLLMGTGRLNRLVDLDAPAYIIAREIEMLQKKLSTSPEYREALQKIKESDEHEAKGLCGDMSLDTWERCKNPRVGDEPFCPEHLAAFNEEMDEEDDEELTERDEEMIAEFSGELADPESGKGKIKN